MRTLVLRRRHPPRRPVVTFVQPYVPDYRAPFFAVLAERLAGAGLELEVVHGSPTAGQASRADASTGPWSVPVTARRLGWRGRALYFRPVVRRARRSTIVVAELASTNLDTYLLALDPRVRLMLWGHGKSYVTDPSRLDSRLELWLADRAERVFVYTEGGAAHLRAEGYDPSRITVVRNSTDTVALRAAAAAFSADDVAAFRRLHGLGVGPVISFVGSYDESKCLPLLIEAADAVHRQLPEVQLLIAGAGPLQDLVEEAAGTRPFVHSLPRANLQALAMIGRVSSFLVIPGRVGLVAVDALALGLPVVTTSFQRHAPELEYLDDNVKFVAERTGDSLAGQIVALLMDTEQLDAASKAAGELGQSLSVSAMAAAFCEGLLIDRGSRDDAAGRQLVSQSPRIAWITNVSAPYRRPVWAALARQVPLAVGVLTDNEPNRRWTAELPPEVVRLRMRALAAHRGELHAYLLWAPVLRGGGDVVVLPGWETPAAWQILVEARIRGIRTVAFYESVSGSHRFSRGPVAWLRRLFFRSVDAVVTVGAASERAMLSFGVAPDRVITTHNTVDVAGIHAASRLRPSPPEERAHQFVYVGQLIHRKNVDGLLAAFALLPGTCRLVVAGEGPDEESLRQQAERIGIADRVEFRGYVPYAQVPQVMAAASTLVLPSRSEVYGLVVMEALAAGLQVVVTRNCGVYADIHGVPGVYPTDPSVVALADAMRTSTAAWRGPLDQPIILGRTPEAMAGDVLRACVRAVSRA